MESEDLPCEVQELLYFNKLVFIHRTVEEDCNLFSFYIQFPLNKFLVFTKIQKSLFLAILSNKPVLSHLEIEEHFKSSRDFDVFSIEHLKHINKYSLFCLPREEKNKELLELSNILRINL